MAGMSVGSMTTAVSVTASWVLVGVGAVVVITAVGVTLEVAVIVGVDAMVGVSVLVRVMGIVVVMSIVVVSVGVGVAGIVHESVEWQLLHLPREWLEGRSPLWHELQFV